MSKTAPLICLLGFGLLVTISASDFWRDKTYTQWTDEEVTKMLSDSPWAQSVKASVRGEQQGMGRRGGGMGRRGGWGMPGGGYPGGGYPGGGYPGGGYPGGGYPGGGGGYPGGGGGYPGGGGGQPMPQVTATVRWQTALPVREALLKQSGSVKTDDSQAAASLTAPLTGYVIAVVGLPESMPTRGRGRYGTTDDTDSRDRSADRDADRLDQLKSATSLNRKDRPSLFPEKVERDKDGSTILFTFPRNAPISLNDKEVEFVTRYGPMEIKHKFKLKDMVYQGRLEL